WHAAGEDRGGPEEYLLSPAHSRLGSNPADYRTVGARQSQERRRVCRLGRAACSFARISLSIEPSKRWKRANRTPTTERHAHQGRRRTRRDGQENLAPRELRLTPFKPG